MILVETVIRKLIIDYEFVILPGIGAFLSHQIPAIYNRELGIFNPPSKKLAFNETLKLDDGLMANYISREESISHMEAVAYIKDYVDAVKLHLNQKGSAIITGIGTFHTNVEGKLVFDSENGKYFKDEWYGLKPIKANLVSKSPKIEQLDGVEAVEVLSQPNNVNYSWGRWIAAACFIGLLSTLSFVSLRNNSDSLSSLNPIELLFGKTEIEEVQIVPELESPVVAEIPVETEIESTNSVEEVVEETIVNPIKTVDEVNLKGYYVIAGAFKDAKRADLLLDRLKSKGYSDALILPKEGNATKIKVAVNKFDDEHDAYRASAKLKSVIGESGWVYHKKK